MEQSIIYLTLVLLGLCMGSFAGASMWRLRASQLVQDKKNDEDVDAKEYKSLHKLIKSSLLDDHSQCLNCSYLLKWYDLIPLFSWIMIGGKCRKCRKPIGYLEPLIELGVAVFFVLSYMFWPFPLITGFDIARLIIWLTSGVGLAILFAYDTKWFLLPDSINFSIVGLGFLNVILILFKSSDIKMDVANIFGSVFVLSGIYLILYIISKGKWIGFGDIKLGLGLALLLADWKLAFIALFAANLVGCIYVLPAMAIGKLNRTSHVPFGPLLIIGFMIAGLAGKCLIDVFFINLIGII